MNTFKQICKMNQSTLKKYMEKFFTDIDYNVVNEDGFLYATPKENSVPVLLVAHMDTVHKEQCDEIVNENGKLSSPQGIGGDDRCGVYMIMDVVKEHSCPVLLTEDEEKGGIGARKFVNSEYINNLNVNYMVEFDRRGSSDAVYYSCDNKEFKEFIDENTFLKEAQGSYSDISTIMPAAKIAGVNVSCGYYNAHTVAEYVVFEEMVDVIDTVKNLIKVKVDEPFKYIAKVYPKFSYGETYGFGHQYSLYDRTYSKKYAKTSINDLDLDIELEVIWSDINGEEQADVCYGKTKAECWFNFFMDNPNACMDMVTDYSWS